MIALENNEFIFTGSKTDTNFVHAALLGKIDGDGELMWSQSYFATENLTEALDVKQTNDNGFILCGRNNDAIFLTKTNENGIEEWSKIYNFDGISAGYSVLQTSDDGFLVGGGYYDLENLEPIILKTNAQGDSLWNKSLSSAQRFITNMQQNIDGSIAVTTAQQGFYNGAHGGFGDLFKIDQDGNIDEHLPLTGQANDIEPDENNCYFIAGSASPPLDYSEHMYFAKISDFVNSTKNISNSNLAEIFPNPSNHFFQIQLSEQSDNLLFEMFDPLGRKVFYQKLTSRSTEISSQNFSNGLYFFTIKDDQQLLQSGKIIIEK